MLRKLFLISIIGMVIGILAACATSTPTPTDLSPGLANPASTNCIDKGGTLEIRKDDAGNEYGVCKFSDGSECEEWAFFREECKPGDMQVWPSPTPSTN